MHYLNWQYLICMHNYRIKIPERCINTVPARIILNLFGYCYVDRDDPAVSGGVAHLYNSLVASAISLHGAVCDRTRHIDTYGAELRGQKIAVGQSGEIAVGRSLVSSALHGELNRFGQTAHINDLALII